MRKNDDCDVQNSVWGFTPLFMSAVGYAALIRILDIYILITSVDFGYALFWLEPVIGFLSLGDLILCTALAFFGLTVFELICKFRSIRNWFTMLTCLLVVAYTVVLCLSVRSLAS